MSKAMVSLSFDDGRGDNWRIFQEVLGPLQVPATFNIATGYINGLCEVRKGSGVDADRLNIDEIKEISKYSWMEIACHGNMHNNDEVDIAFGRKALLEWLDMPQETLLGFASPGSGMTPEYIRRNQRRLRNLGFSYVRTSADIKSFAQARVLCRKASRILHSGRLFCIAYKDTVQDRADGMLITSVPILHDTTLREIEAIIREAKQRNASITLMFHSILKPEEPFYDDAWSYDYCKFQSLISDLRAEHLAGELSLFTTQEVHKRLLEECNHV